MSILQAIVSIDDVWDSIPLPMGELELEHYPLCGGAETIGSPGFHLMDVNCEKAEIETALRKADGGGPVRERHPGNNQSAQGGRGPRPVLLRRGFGRLPRGGRRQGYFGLY